MLIVGESGSGKELVARELHRLGPRPAAPFVAINSAALPEQLVESELFGHERGAFTGAAATRKGAFEAAERGTLFLDEIGELPLAGAGQAAARARGAPGDPGRRQAAAPVEARVVAATNRDLEAEVDGRPVPPGPLLPPQRAPDSRCRRCASGCPTFRSWPSASSAPSARASASGPRSSSGDALELLMGYDWRRNNVRELRNVVERMIIAADGEVHRSRARSARDPGARAGAGAARRRRRTFHELKAEAERQIVIAALERNDWHITRTAEELGLADHASLLKIMRRLDLKKEQ